MQQERKYVLAFSNSIVVLTPQVLIIQLLTTTPATGPADDTIIIGNPDDAGEVKHFMGEGWKVYSIEFILTGLLQMKVDHER